MVTTSSARFEIWQPASRVSVNVGTSRRALTVTLREMVPVPVDAAALYREEVARARSMSLEEKLLEGPRLFDRACRLMADGIQHEQPGLEQEAVDRLIRSRLARLATLDP